MEQFPNDPRERIDKVRDEIKQKENRKKEFIKIAESMGDAAKAEVIIRFTEKYPDLAKNTIMNEKYHKFQFYDGSFFDDSIVSSISRLISKVTDGGDWSHMKTEEKESSAKDWIEEMYEKIKIALSPEELERLEKGE